MQGFKGRNLGSPSDPVDGPAIGADHFRQFRIGKLFVVLIFVESFGDGVIHWLWGSHPVSNQTMSMPA